MDMSSPGKHIKVNVVYAEQWGGGSHYTGVSYVINMHVYFKLGFITVGFIY